MLEDMFQMLGFKQRCDSKGTVAIEAAISNQDMTIGIEP